MSRTADGRYRKARAALRAKRLPCHICGGAIDYSAPQHHPASFEADHVIAVQHGGSNHGALAPAHAHCNRSRGAREMDRKPKVLEHMETVRVVDRWL